jgi:fucose 4-O-acetylase-like acetyltransferase
VLIPFAPKCPLCLLPLFAAAGIALPPKPLLDGLVVAAAAAWAATVLATARWAPVRASALAAVLLLVAGRVLDATWASGLGAALVLGVWYWTRRRPRACGAAFGVGHTRPSGCSTEMR